MLCKILVLVLAQLSKAQNCKVLLKLRKHQASEAALLEKVLGKEPGWQVFQVRKTDMPATV